MEITGDQVRAATLGYDFKNEHPLTVYIEDDHFVVKSETRMVQFTNCNALAQFMASWRSGHINNGG